MIKQSDIEITCKCGKLMIGNGKKKKCFECKIYDKKTNRDKLK